MAGLLYYLPGLQRGQQEEIAQRLEHLGAVVTSQCQCTSGPDKKTGLIIAVADDELIDGGKQPAVGYYPDKQTWRQFENYWIGYVNSQPPVPADLQRKDSLQGHLVTLNGGGKWLIPCERFLPNDLEMDDDGNLQMIPLSEFEAIKNLSRKGYADYWAAVEAVDRKESVPEPQLTAAEQVELVTGFLAINYRIGRREANLLHLWRFSRPPAIIEAMRAIWDIPGLLKMIAAQDTEIKKKLPQPSTAG